MEKYIPKSALVAEIKKLSQKSIELYGYSQFNTAYNNVLSVLDTLEAKEVDLEEEIDKELDEEWYGEYINHEKFKKSAKHFFEFGLKAKGE